MPDRLTDFEHSLVSISKLLGELSTALQTERDALTVRDLNRLRDATEAKAALLEQLEPQAQVLQEQPARSLLDELDAENRKNLELHHKAVIDQARQAKDFNTVNGKILARSQQSLLELARLLSTNAQDDTYGEQGKLSQHTNAASTGTLAKA